MRGVARARAGSRTIVALALCAALAPAFAAEGVDPARIDRLIDATGMAKRMGALFGRIEERGRSELAEAREDSRERVALGLELLRFASFPHARPEWRDGIARRIDADTVAAAEAFYASEPGRALAACLADAVGDDGMDACAADPKFADLPEASVRFLDPDFLLRVVSDDEHHEALLARSVCRGLANDRALLERLAANCRRETRPPQVCAVVAERDGRVALDPATCSPP